MHTFSFNAWTLVQSRKESVTYDALTIIIANRFWREHSGMNTALLTCFLSPVPLTIAEVCTNAGWLRCDWAMYCCFPCPLCGSLALLCGICIPPFVNSSDMHFKYSRILYSLSGIHNKDASIPKSFDRIQRTCRWDAWFTFFFKESVSFWLASHWMSVRSYLF